MRHTELGAGLPEDQALGCVTNTHSGGWDSCNLGSTLSPIPELGLQNFALHSTRHAKDNLHKLFLPVHVFNMSTNIPTVFSTHSGRKMTTELEEAAIYRFQKVFLPPPPPPPPSFLFV